MAVDGVDLTALVIAYARELESRRPDRLFDDPWARLFVDASGRQRPDPGLTSAGREGSTGASWVAVRTRFIDEALLDASRSCGQVVLLGAGLDTRALRLTWPKGTTVFEVDTPVLFEFKEPVLANAGVPLPISPASRVVVRTDLTGDWAGALHEAGLQTDAPTAWVAEGLLLYLTHEEGDLLLAGLSALSAPGSRLLLSLTPEGQGRRDDAQAECGQGWHNAYRVSDGPSDPIRWLAAHGWVSGEPEHVGALALRYGRTPLPEDDPDLPPRRLLVNAQRAGSLGPRGCSL